MRSWTNLREGKTGVRGWMVGWDEGGGSEMMRAMGSVGV